MTLIIGHRGAAGVAPENTLRSFALAIEQGADALELDIHVSADGAIVVCHDATVDRTTNGTGSIARLKIADLRTLDAGSWFAPEYAGERLPLLEEVFELVPAHILINIEIKCPYSTEIATRLLVLLWQYERLNTSIISSFNHKTLVRLKRLQPALRIGLLYSANFQSHPLAAESAGIEIYSLHPDYLHLDKEDIKAALDGGFQIFPYTLNMEADWRSLVEANVSGIITDYPGRLKTFITSTNDRRE